MYERFYRLRERPFALTPDPDYLYPSRVHREALSYLRYGIESHAGFVVITGAIGSGKTTLLQTLLRGLDGQTTVARVMNTLLEPRELIESAMLDLDLEPAASKPAMLKQLGDFLAGERMAGRLVLMVIDEAQNLTLPALEEIRMLSNLETEKSKLMQIVLVGQPDLRDKLDRPELEQLRQRITVSYHLRPLDRDETANYINHRLARASIDAPLAFPKGATDRIHDRSGGVPRVINVIADATLVFGYGEERFEIDEALVQEVVRDLDETGVLGPRAEPSNHPSVVPVQAQVPQAPASINGFRDAVDRPPASYPPDHELLAREIAVREREVHAREQELAGRERELTAQRRVLAEQLRVLRGQDALVATPPAVSAGPVWPPVTDAEPRRPDPPPQTWEKGSRGAVFNPVRSDVRAYSAPAPRGMWRRVKQTLLGTSEPLVEDSLR